MDNNNNPKSLKKTQHKDDQGQDVKVVEMVENTTANAQKAPSEELAATQQALNHDQTKDPGKNQTRLMNLLNCDTMKEQS